MRYLILILFLTLGCSAEYHLKQAVKKNPQYGEKETFFIPYYHDTVIYKTIVLPGDSSSQKTKLVIDSLNTVFNDSFTTVYQLVDSLGNLVTSVKRKPRVIHDTTIVIFHDTIKVEVDRRITVPKEKTPNYIYVLGLVSFILFLLLLHRIYKSK